jgi:hypothetical protein
MEAPIHGRYRAWAMVIIVEPEETSFLFVFPFDGKVRVSPKSGEDLIWICHGSISFFLINFLDDSVFEGEKAAATDIIIVQNCPSGIFFNYNR